jgi:hypothetical protein
MLHVLVHARFPGLRHHDARSQDARENVRSKHDSSISRHVLPMIRPCYRAVLRSFPQSSLCSASLQFAHLRAFSAARQLRKDARIEDIGRVIKDDYAAIRENYSKFHPALSISTSNGF